MPTFSSTAASEALPLPENKVDSVEQLGKAITSAGEAMGETQVAVNGSTVTTWTGAAADAHAASATSLQNAIKKAVNQHPTVQKALDNYAEALGTAISEVKTAQTDWDNAIDTYNKAIQGIDDSLQAGEISDDEAATKKEVAETTAAFDQADAKVKYTQALMALGAVALTSANWVNSAADSFIPRDQASTTVPGATTTTTVNRSGVEFALFGDDDGILGAQAQWNHAQTEAAEAAEFFDDSDLTEQEVKEFVEKYGDEFNNPFFANALAAKVDPADMIRILEQTDASWEGASELNAGVGTMVVLATGGNDASSEYCNMWEMNKGALHYSDSHNSVEEQQKAFAEQVRAAGNATYGTDSRDNPIYGYQWLGSALAAAGSEAAGSTGLVIGDGFLNGYDDGKPSIAQDMLKWDNEHLQSAYAGGVYSARGCDPGGFFGDSPKSADPVYALLTLMDGPSGSGIDAATAASMNEQRISTVRKFMAADSLVTGSDGTPLSVTEYMTGHRFAPNDTFTVRRNGYGEEITTDNPQYWGYADQGMVLGKIIDDVTSDTSNSAAPYIVSEYLDGYSYGLAHEDSQYNGQDRYGYENRGLRSASAAILEEYAGDLAMKRATGTSGAHEGVYDPNDQRYHLKLTTEQTSNLRSSGFYIDLGHDKEALSGLTNATMDHFAADYHSAALAGDSTDRVRDGYKGQMDDYVQGEYTANEHAVTKDDNGQFKYDSTVLGLVKTCATSIADEIPVAGPVVSKIIGLGFDTYGDASSTAEASAVDAGQVRENLRGDVRDEIDALGDEIDERVEQEN
ncbi:hypothetical protein [Actinobaculum sp. 313]|uniref:hypothetical protein n=1 Tax=Actinobaculum sp. 313 TaxID=2495645 RepID=UPI000D528479|nr:hypothetical protein [Actinobaculum sp. 313]AWE42062.1 hypothetical protein DDD63_03995 [Actinobaculum sp. 313]